MLSVFVYVYVPFANCEEPIGDQDTVSLYYDNPELFCKWNLIKIDKIMNDKEIKLKQREICYLEGHRDAFLSVINFIEMTKK